MKDQDFLGKLKEYDKKRIKYLNTQLVLLAEEIESKSKELDEIDDRYKTVLQKLVEVYHEIDSRDIFTKQP